MTNTLTTHSDPEEAQLDKLSADLVEAYETLTLIYRTVSSLGGLFRLEDIAGYLLNRSLEATQGTSGLVLLRGGDGHYSTIAQRGDARDRLHQDAAGRCHTFGRAMFFHGPLAADFTRTGAPAIRNLLCSPLETGGRVLGMLLLLRDADEQFTTGHAKLVGALCGLAAVAVANFQHYRAVNYEREMLEGVIREIGDGIVVTDESFHTRMTNAAARVFLEVSESEPEGFDALTRLGRYELSVSEAQLRAGDLVPAAFHASSRDPRRPLVLQGKVLRSRLGTDGTPIRILCLRDVTQEQRDASAQRDFLSVASHKLRTPLTKVLGLLPIARDAQAGDEVKESAFDGIESGANELRELVDGVLQFVEFRQARRVVRAVRIADLLEEALREVRSNRRDRDIEVELRIEGDPIVEGSWQMLRTMVGHLLDNAVKFSVGARAWVSVDVEVSADRGVRIAVGDRGDGIAPELLNRLFEPFSQRDEEFTGQADGAGLGLMLVRLAVEKHGGRLFAESRLGAGSRFVVELPFRHEET